MGGYINTRDVIGEQATLDALVAHTRLSEFVDTDVRSLRSRAFEGNTILERIVLPNLDSIQTMSFRNCTGLKYIEVGGNKDSVTSLYGTNAFSGAGRWIALVPDALVSDYRNANNWSVFADRIYGINDEHIPTWNESEITDSVEQIAAKVANGTAATSYTYGQYKSIDLGSEGIVRFQIIGINADELSDGTGRAQLTWFPMELLNSGHKMNENNNGNAEGTGGIGGWDKCEMKSYLLETIWPLIPEAWRNMIKTVKKYSKTYNTSGNIVNNVLTNETIWLPSFHEIFPDSTGMETQGVTYGYAFPTSIFALRRRQGATSGTGSEWWLRTATGTNYFGYVQITGGSNTLGKPSAKYYVVFGFCT